MEDELVKEIIASLEILVKSDGNSIEKHFKGLTECENGYSFRLRLIGKHHEYVRGINDSLRILSDKCGFEYKQILPVKFKL